MKRLSLFIVLMMAWSLGFAQSSTYRESLRVNLTSDGQAYMVGFLAPQSNGKAVVVIPGGGYQQTSIDKYYAWAAFFNRIGVSMFAVKYRMPEGNRRIPIDDAERALQTVHDSAAAWRISPRWIGIMGTSAGGHLASTMATQAPEAIRPAFQILCCPVITMGRVGSHKGSVDRFLGKDAASDKVRAEYSSNKRVDAHTPPALIFTSVDDKTVPVEHNAMAYYEAMVKAQRPVSIQIYPEGGHTGTSMVSFRYHQAMETMITTWLNALK
ncbi:MAG: alpha/beta hydrolase [Prevotella sp.]|nr:alpha/beta hydrolase [Prevotella sp.]